jgi:glutathione synthase
VTTPRVIFVVNSLSDLLESMTTTRLLFASAALGYETLVSGLDGVQVQSNGRPTLDATRVDPATDGSTALSSELSRLRAARCVACDLRPSDWVVARINPARFGLRAQHELLLTLLECAEEQGTQVVNSIRGLRRASNKALLPTIAPGLCPTQEAVGTLAAALKAVERLGPELVLKPVQGSRGQGVTFVDTRLAHPQSVIETLLQSGPLIVQERLPDAALGDQRVLLVNGAPFEVEGQVVAIRRRPAPGELRANLHLGGTAELSTLSQSDFNLLRRLKPQLQRLGLSLVGADLMSSRLLELNVFAPGGLGPFEQLTGLSASQPVMRALIGDTGQ